MVDLFVTRARTWLAFAIVLTIATTTAEAQVVPFKVTGAGVIVDSLPPVAGASAKHIAVGRATHLGRYHGEGVVRIETINLATLSGTFSSDVPFVFEAADGSKLVFQYGRTDAASGASPPAVQNGDVTFEITSSGQLIAVWDAEFNPVPLLCTGRFHNVVAGSFRMIAVTEPFDFGPLPAGLGYSWHGQGHIAYDR